MKYIMVAVKAYRRRTKSQLTPQHFEFGRSCKGSHLIQGAFNALTRESKDCRKCGQLTQVIFKAMKTDELHAWGERRFQDGDISLLQGYDFNARKKLGSIIRLPIMAEINGVTGICSVTIPSFVPYKDLCYDKQASHVRFSIGAACFDFEANSFNSRIAQSGFLPMEKETTVKLMTMINVADERPIFLVLGIEFFNKINGRYLLPGPNESMCLNIVQTGRGIVNP
jgi:hypothetical protein